MTLRWEHGVGEDSQILRIRAICYKEEEEKVIAAETLGTAEETS